MKKAPGAGRPPRLTPLQKSALIAEYKDLLKRYGISSSTLRRIEREQKEVEK